MFLSNPFIYVTSCHMVDASRLPPPVSGGEFPLLFHKDLSVISQRLAPEDLLDDVCSIFPFLAASTSGTGYDW